MRTILFVLVAFVGISATLIGLTMIAYPNRDSIGFSMESITHDLLLVPGMALTVAGLINIVAVFAFMLRSHKEISLSIAGGAVLTGLAIIWIILLSFYHWLQFVMLATGILVVLLSFQLKGKWAA